MDGKIDCTHRSDGPWKVVLLAMAVGPDTESVLAEIADRLETLSGIEVLTRQWSDMDTFMQGMTGTRPQALIIVSRWDDLATAHALAHRHNLTFHNSPNILIGPHDGVDPLTVCTRHPAFDLAITEGDVAALLSLFGVLTARDSDDDQIDLSAIPHLLWRNHGELRSNL